MTRDKAFLAIADYLIPAHGKMPAFSSVCTFADAEAALDFRIDLKEGFARGLDAGGAVGIETRLETLNREDAAAFSAVSTIAVCTYYMNPRVRELLGYPGQESVQYDSQATQVYLTDGSLGRVLARAPRYRPTPGL